MKRYNQCSFKNFWEMCQYLEKHQEYNVISMYYDEKDKEHVAYYWYEDLTFL